MKSRPRLSLQKLKLQLALTVYIQPKLIIFNIIIVQYYILTVGQETPSVHLMTKNTIKCET